jgi:putative endonuclease
MKMLTLPPIWTLYILRCGDDTLYTGITLNIERRLQEHRAQGAKCAKYLRGRTPLTLVYSETLQTKGAALRRELTLKKLSRAEKEALIATAQTS